MNSKMYFRALILSYHILHRIRYVLDNFATVEEAVEGLSKLRLIHQTFCKQAPHTEGKGFVFGVHVVSRQQMYS